MKAFVVERYGKDGLVAADVPEPTVGSRDVLVQVSAASINPLDKMVRNGEFKWLLKYKTPFVLGHDVAGVVTGVGADVRDYKADDEEKVRGLGANQVIDYTKADFAELLSGYDVVLDSLGGDNLKKSLTVLRPGGLAISVVGPPDAAFAEQVGRPLLKPVMVLMSRKVRAQARKLGVRYSFFFMRADGEQLKTLAALYDAGALRPVLDR